uniref:Immunoglobulin V-set domain-containing protein n=1 Tax=Paramormyrops kingsleyae TaxID=1676925 RepID=A0A3B3R1J1_9TELE
MFILYYMFLMLRHSCSLPIAAQSVRTESWVSARRGGPATISCYYDQNYKDKTKYLCRGYERDSCSTIAQSDGEQSRGKVSVSDDRDQMVFNVIISDMQEKDFDYYWCAVEASAAQNDRAFVFQHSVVRIRGSWFAWLQSRGKGGVLAVGCRADELMG